MKPKWRKPYFLLGLVALAVATFILLKPSDEPYYQGRALSKWLAVFRGDVYFQQSPEFAQVREALLNIGTNSLPYLLKWIRYEPPAWRGKLRRHLPGRISDNDTFQSWLQGRDGKLASHAHAAFAILGTNALSALPELEALMKDSSAPNTSARAISALGSLGKSSLPSFEAALADPNQTNRYRIIGSIRAMARQEGTNTCLPVLLKALTNDDLLVRIMTTNVLTQIAPDVLTNAPSQ